MRDPQKIAYKPYPCGFLLQPFLYCASRLKRNYRIDVDDIAEVWCRGPSGMVPLVFEPIEDKVASRTPYEGKFSLPFTVAAMLAEGKVDLTTFSEEKIMDRKTLKLAEIVKYTTDPNIDYPKHMPRHP